MKRKFINPTSLPNWSSMFTQVVVTEKNGLNFIHISGQVGVDSTKKLVGNGSLQDQTRQALVNLQIALNSVGATTNDVVKLLIYVKNYHYEQAAVIREELQRVFVINQLPALSLIGIVALAEEHFLIEIDADAIAEIESEDI
jgi:enamine deaminase RidA (YjgF/YER057c/UK114 family)